MKKNVILVFSGPSGSGKTTLIKKLIEDFPDFILNKSYTTRLPREKEVDYFFVNKEFFEKNKDSFFEIVEYNNNLYGIHLDFLKNKTIFIVDYRGFKSLQKNNKVISFFIYADLNILKERLINRKEIEIEKRLKIAETEFFSMSEYDFILNNIDLDKTYEEIKKIIEKIFN